MKTSISKLLFFTILSFNLFAAEEIVSTVMIIKGDVKAKLADGKIVELKTAMGLVPGSYIKTSVNSFVKLQFIDRSYMTIGPSSLVKISSYSKNEAGIIAVIRGQIRSQVTKNYMELEDKNKSKLFIRTKTAAMGIRGTDFQVNFSEKNDRTTLLTYEGKVALNLIDRKDIGRELSTKDLDTLLERKERIMVAKGLSSEVHNETKRLDQPKKIEQKIIEKLQKLDVPVMPKYEQPGGIIKKDNNESETDLIKNEKPVDTFEENATLENNPNMPEIPDKLGKPGEIIKDTKPLELEVHGKPGEILLKEPKEDKSIQINKEEVLLPPREKQRGKRERFEKREREEKQESNDKVDNSGPGNIEDRVERPVEIKQEDAEKLPPPPPREESTIKPPPLENGGISAPVKM